MEDFLAGFIAESETSLARLDEAVLALERFPADPAAIALIFRLVHTFKGSSVFLGLHRLEHLAHATEDVLEATRQAGEGAAPPVRAALFAAAGGIRTIIAVLASCGSEPPGVDHALIALLESLTAPGPAAPAPPSQARASGRHMRPVGDIWRRLHRLAEGLGVELGKSIELVTEGGDTRIHRSTFADLSAPLMHMVRNSADHGLETAPERAALGKHAVGTIRLTAKGAGELVVLTIADDGRGLSMERIRATILADGLAGVREVAAMNDEALAAFIFRPGFSSARGVTRTSGRGVGLDVTRTWIESIGGAITVTSVPALGASFRLVFPRGEPVATVSRSSASPGRLRSGHRRTGCEGAQPRDVTLMLVESAGEHVAPRSVRDKV